MLTSRIQPLAALASLALISLTGCSSKENVIPPSDTNISEIYHNQSTANVSRSMRMAVNLALEPSDTPIDAYQLHNMKQTNYVLLPNPTLYMYVNTRITEEDRVPVPAFITEFKMFERDEYALPSEVNINWRNR